MKLPFTTQQFLDVFRKYNHAVYPLQVFFVLLAVFAIFLAVRKAKSTDKAIFIILATLWLWMGIVYHIGFFTTINKAAYSFGVLFILEGLSLLYFAFNHSCHFTFRKSLNSFTGCLLIVYALVVYPVIGQLSGHAYPYAPTFGLPCPTTIFTFGIFLLSAYRLPLGIALIPILWSFIGFSAALNLGMIEDIGIIIACLLFIFLNTGKLKSHKPTHVTVV